jgi:hypothetical protein
LVFQILILIISLLGIYPFAFSRIYYLAATINLSALLNVRELLYSVLQMYLPIYWITILFLFLMDFFNLFLFSVPQIDHLISVYIGLLHYQHHLNFLFYFILGTVHIGLLHHQYHMIFLFLFLGIVHIGLLLHLILFLFLFLYFIFRHCPYWATAPSAPFDIIFIFILFLGIVHIGLHQHHFYFLFYFYF